MVRQAPPADDALGRALAARDPGYQALHISTHGTPAGLLLEDAQGREVLLPTARLAPPSILGSRSATMGLRCSIVSAPPLRCRTCDVRAPCSSRPTPTSILQ